MNQPPDLTITNIRPAVKNPRRANIFIDQKYSFSLDIDQLVELKLKIGQILTPEQVVEFRNLSEFGKLYQATLSWILTKPRSVKETYNHLRLKQLNRANSAPISDQIINQVIDRLLIKGHLDDNKFTKYYIQNRFLKKGISSRRLKQELLKKGINQDLIEKTLSESCRSDALEIQKIIAKKAHHYTSNQLIQYLVRQGFDYHLSQNSVHEMGLQNSAQTPDDFL